LPKQLLVSYTPGPVLIWLTGTLLRVILKWFFLALENFSKYDGSEYCPGPGLSNHSDGGGCPMIGHFSLDCAKNIF